MKKSILTLAFAVAAAAVSADTWWVKKDGGVDAAGYGTAEATPFRTIQYAINAAAEHDTILVAPGVYDEGGGVSDGYTNRVNVTKHNLTIRSTGGAAVTHIVGAKDPNSTMGNGPAAVRCVRSAGGSVILEGFTLRDGAAFMTSNTILANGGGLYAGGQTTYLVDCVVSNCVGVRAGAMYGGTAVRCLITENYASVKANGGNGSRFFNCLLVRNNSAAGGATAVNCKVVNCTLGDFNEGEAFTESCTLVNTVVTLPWSKAKNQAQNATSDGSVDHIAINSVVPFDRTQSGKAFFKTFTDSCVTNVHLLKAPAFGDYRLLPGTVATGIGDAAQLAAYDVDERIDRYRDLTGRPFPHTGAIAAGCYQEIAPAPVCGALAFSPNIEVAGRWTQSNGCYAYPDAYPTQIWIKAAPPEGYRTLRFTQTATDGFSCPWAPITMDDRLLLLPPPAVTNTLRTDLTYTASVRYVNPETGDDELNDGLTDAAPFKTLQRAVDTVTNQSTVVFCAAGEYSEGGRVSYGVTNRVLQSSGYAVRFIGAGADSTIIRGAADMTSEGHSDDGRGPAAVRCVCIGSGTMFQGFTFADGHSTWDGGTGDDVTSRGGGVLYNSTTYNGTLHLTDCVITNCSATRGGAAYSATLTRTRITDCYSTVCGLRSSRLYACLVDNNPADTASTKFSILGPDANLYFCTALGRSRDEYLFDGSDPMRNSVIVSTRSIGGSTPPAQGCYAWDIKEYNANNAGVQRRDPQFADAENGDYAILASSPAAGGGVELGDTDYRYWTPGYDGCPITFVGNRPTAGAFQRLRPAYSVTAAYGDFVGLEGGATNAVAIGGSVTVTYTNGVRRCLGISVNGEFLEGVYSYTYAAPADASTPASVGRITAEVFSPDWYVDAEHGSDANDGFTPATAKRTLADAMTNTCLLAGDTVHALPGTYDEGSQLMGAVIANPSTATRSRVVVPNNVTLVSTDGPEKTIIKGAPATSGVNEYGMGSGAVRCAGVYANSSIEGFTLTGGRTDKANVDADDNDGAAVLCANRTTSQIVDCIISNNASVRRIVVLGTCINCRILENTVTVNSILRDGYLYNCVVDRNRGAYTAYSLLGIYNCTFGPDNKTLSGGNTEVVDGTPCPLYNSLCLCHVRTNYRPSNCALLTGSTMPSAANRTNCIVMAQADYMLDGDFRPVSYESPLVDAGSNAWLTAETAAGDILGGQRVYNGRVDIGAHEFDWRARYAQLLGGGPRLAVTNASPDAVAVEGGVRLTDGASLGIAWKGEDGGLKTEYRFTAALDGEGELTAELNGSAPAAVPAGEQRFITTVPVNALGFAYAGEGSATLSAFTRRTFGTTILFR